MPSFNSDPYPATGHLVTSPHSVYSHTFKNTSQTVSSQSPKTRHTSSKPLSTITNKTFINSRHKTKNYPVSPTSIESRTNGIKRHRSSDFKSEYGNRTPSGLGIIIEDKENELLPKVNTKAMNSSLKALDKTSGPASFLVDELAEGFPDFSSPPIIFSSTLENEIDVSRSLDDDFFVKHEMLYVPSYLTSRILKTSEALAFLEDSELSRGPMFYDYSILQSPLESFSMGSSVPYSHVVDVNMFDKKEDEVLMYVKPQDLILNRECTQPEPETNATCVKLEEVDREGDNFVLSSPKTVDKIEGYITPRSPAISEKLPHILRDNLEHQSQHPIHDVYSERPISHSIPTITKRIFNDLPGPSTFTSLLPHEIPFTPISSALLETMEESNSPPRKKKRMIDLKVNSNQQIVSGVNTKLGINVVELYESLIPQDVVLQNTYLGVSGEDVARKTKYFMMINPGKRLSDELIFTFAGRLSEGGEVMQGYRCYLNGCSKMTKRKDHMGDHVRTHLGEKPFQCGVW